ncbi:hypothetical protein ACFL1E_05985 [Candidatus Omnitrophota bacterium]
MKEIIKAVMAKKRFIKQAIQVLAIPTAFLACLIFYDCFSGSSGENDVASITHKYKASARRGYSYNIKAKGKYAYNEEVYKTLYDAAKVGDTLKLQLTILFKEWKKVELLRDGKIIAVGKGIDLPFMLLFGFAFLIPLYSFFLFKKPIGLLKALNVGIVIIVLEIVALLILIKFGLVILHILPKV